MKKLNSFSVGSRQFKPVMLAPMSGISDYPFRRIVRKASACLTFSEMVASKAVIEDLRDARKLKSGFGERDLEDAEAMVVQLAGTEPELCAEAARIVADRGAIGIDLNFGCPARRVVHKASGSALMRDEDLCQRIFEAVIKAVEVPVSVKMRLGWDDQTINAPHVAKLAQDAGAHAVTVHGRTRCQFYKGVADWNAIAAVKRTVNIPLIVNGDIGDVAEAKTALQQSEADAVMIGRKAVGRPWALGEVSAALGHADVPNLTHQDKCNLVYEHIELTLGIYGERDGIRMLRKHLIGYAETLIPDADARTCFIKDMVKLEEHTVLNSLVQAALEVPWAVKKKAA